MKKKLITLAMIASVILSVSPSFAYVEMGNAYIMGTALYCSGTAPCFADFNNGCQQFTSGTKYLIYNANGDGRWEEYIIYSENDDTINEKNNKSKKNGFNEGSFFTIEPVPAIAH